uniref:Uncharacterized protein n=1 Tax=Moniliophthora roreri TaxID=221103 RepID=A0A0W0F8B3_MONRR
MLNSHPTDGRVYARVVYPLRDGIPLWFPEDNASPNFLEEHQSTGVRVGDVGILSPEGRFDFIFNICHPEDDPVQWKVPDDFVQMEDSPPMEEIPKYFGKRVISRIDDSKRELLPANPFPRGIPRQGGAEYTVGFSRGIGAAGDDSSGKVYRIYHPAEEPALLTHAFSLATKEYLILLYIFVDPYNISLLHHYPKELALNFSN